MTLDEILNSPKRLRTQKLENHLRDMLSRILDVDKEHIQKDTSFFDIGMSSLLAEKFNSELQTEFGDKCKFTAATAFNYSTLGLLVDYIEKSVFPES